MADVLDPSIGDVPVGHFSHVLASWPKVLEGLDLAKEMELRGKLALKLSKAYEEVSAVAKDGRNTEHKYNFASAETIYATCRAGMAKVGLAILPFMGSSIEAPILKKDQSGERRGAYLQVQFDYCLIDTETGYTVVIPWVGEVMEYGDKAYNKASTNATKYMLRTLFLLPVDKDDDPDKGSEQGRPALRHGTVQEPVTQAKPRDDSVPPYRLTLNALGANPEHWAEWKAAVEHPDRAASVNGSRPSGLIIAAAEAGSKCMADAFAWLEKAYPKDPFAEGAPNMDPAKDYPNPNRAPEPPKETERRDIAEAFGIPVPLAPEEAFTQPPVGTQPDQLKRSLANHGALNALSVLFDELGIPEGVRESRGACATALAWLASANAAAIDQLKQAAARPASDAVPGAA